MAVCATRGQHSFKTSVSLNLLSSPTLAEQHMTSCTAVFPETDFNGAFLRRVRVLEVGFFSPQLSIWAAGFISRRPGEPCRTEVQNQGKADSSVSVNCIKLLTGDIHCLILRKYLNLQRNALIGACRHSVIALESGEGLSWRELCRDFPVFYSSALGCC